MEEVTPELVNPEQIQAYDSAGYGFVTLSYPDKLAFPDYAYEERIDPLYNRKMEMTVKEKDIHEREESYKISIYWHSVRECKGQIVELKNGNQYRFVYDSSTGQTVMGFIKGSETGSLSFVNDASSSSGERPW